MYINLSTQEAKFVNRLIVTDVFRINLVRGPWNKEMKFQNKGAVLVQIAPLFIKLLPYLLVNPTVKISLLMPLDRVVIIWDFAAIIYIWCTHYTT